MSKMRSKERDPGIEEDVQSEKSTNFIVSEKNPTRPDEFTVALTIPYALPVPRPNYDCIEGGQN